MVNHAGGIAFVTFIVALAVSMTYYQFVYIPQANAKPILPKIITDPPEVTNVKISPGSSVQSNPQFFVPKAARAPLGLSNHVVWTNTDTVPHTVTSDTDYVDQINGKFDSRARPQEEGGAFVMPGKTFEFTFTKLGEYHYHCEPHPWMQASVDV